MKAADELPKRLDRSRSKRYATALDHSLRDQNECAVTAKLNEAYATDPSALDPVLQSIQARSIPKERWR